MKKTLAIVVALLMVMTLIPVASGAEKISAFRPVKADLDMTARAQGKTVAARDDEVFVDGSLVYSSFEASENIFNNGWARVDYDGDGYYWYNDTQSGADYSHTGTAFVFSYSYYQQTALSSDNWLLTPEFVVPSNGAVISLYAMSINATYKDHFQVLIGEEGEAYDDTSLYADSWTTLIGSTEAPASSTGTPADGYAQFTANIPASMAGSTVRVCIRHKDTDELALMIDDVSIGQIGEAVDETGVGIYVTDENDELVAINSLALDLTYAEQLTAVVEPTNATFKDVSWSSSDPTVANVNMVGGVMAMGVGTATITVTTHNGVTASIPVTVSQGDYDFAVDNLLVYGIYDYDASAYANTYYQVDQFVLCTPAITTDEGVEASAWSEADRLIYAYDGDGNFISYDPLSEDFTMTVIATGVEAPYWMAYGFDTEEMYGGFAAADSDGYITNFYIAKIDLATGAMGDILVDTYTTEDYFGDTYFLPFWGTYAGDGMFFGGDVNYNELFIYAPNFVYQDQDLGFVVMNAGNYPTAQMFGGSPDTYYQSMYYNPFDGMLYWACNDEQGLHMTVLDSYTGIAVNTGTLGEATADNGLITTSMFYIYVFANTYTVTFYDIDGNVLDVQEVEEGGAAVAPEAPEVEGYTFVGWDADFSNVTSDMDIYPIYEQNQTNLMLGDVDCNGVVNFTDISVLYAFLLNQASVTEQGQLNADVNQDGSVSFTDVSALYAFLVGA